MTQLQRDAISRFRDSIAELRQVGVIRSDRYLGDIGEFLCADRYGITLATNCREVGYDGTIGADRVQVKYHGGKSTTVSAGDPGGYQFLYVVLGPDSVLRSVAGDNFLIYRFSAEELLADGRLRLTIGRFEGRDHDEV